VCRRCQFHTVVAALVISAKGSRQAGTEHAAAGMESRSRRLCGKEKERIESGFEVVI
jgi:hypothetical protein